jgi:SAM-dependent methyltransferase
VNALTAALNITPTSGPRSVLIAGSGPDRTNLWEDQGFQTTYLDIEARTNPDIVADMTDMGEIGLFDMVYCCHALEHLYPHQVNLALKEFKRVLKQGGAAMIVVPDLEGVKPNNQVLERSDRAPITGLHLFYGDHTQIPEYPFMAHHCGFIAETLEYALTSAGLKAQTMRQPDFNLVGIGINLE